MIYMSTGRYIILVIWQHEDLLVHLLAIKNKRDQKLKLKFIIIVAKKIQILIIFNKKLI